MAPRMVAPLGATMRLSVVFLRQPDPRHGRSGLSSAEGDSLTLEVGAVPVVRHVSKDGRVLVYPLGSVFCWEPGAEPERPPSPAPPVTPLPATRPERWRDAVRPTEVPDRKAARK